MKTIRSLLSPFNGTYLLLDLFGQWYCIALNTKVQRMFLPRELLTFCNTVITHTPSDLTGPYNDVLKHRSLENTFEYYNETFDILSGGDINALRTTLKTVPMPSASTRKTLLRALDSFELRNSIK